MVRRLFYYMTLVAAVLLTACSDNDATIADEPLPEGMGRLRITLCTPEENPNLTRAVNVNPWEDPDHEWERLQTFRVFICKSSNNQIVQIIEGDKTQMSLVSGTTSTYKQSVNLLSDPLPAGTYKIYATANFADGYSVGDVINLDRTEKFANGYSEANIPMTGQLDGTVTVVNAKETDAGTISVWRVMAKLQFEFTNEASDKIDIYGIEVEPINQIASGADAGKGLIYLFSKDDLTSTANLAANGGVTLPTSVTTGRAKYLLTTPDDPLLELTAWSGSGTKPAGNLFFYVNETDATYTVTQNQLSLRFKIKRGDATVEELRYGVTTHYGNGSTGQDGFNVIRRNDWIYIPIILTDWQFRVEPIALAPIAGYPATLLSSDALTATFNTGGMIALQPFVKKKGDNTWRDFGDSRITNLSVSWKNSNGTDVAGSDKIVKTAFQFDPVTKTFIGELNNSLSAGTYMTTFTVNAQLDSYPYSFTFNVVLQK